MVFAGECIITIENKKKEKKEYKNIRCKTKQGNETSKQQRKKRRKANTEETQMKRKKKEERRKNKQNDDMFVIIMWLLPANGLKL